MYDYATDGCEFALPSPLLPRPPPSLSLFLPPSFHSGSLPAVPPARLSRRAVKNRSCHGHRRHFKKPERPSGAREGERASERANGRETNGRISASANRRSRLVAPPRNGISSFVHLILPLPIHLFLERPSSVAARSVRLQSIPLGRNKEVAKPRPVF